DGDAGQRAQQPRMDHHVIGERAVVVAQRLHHRARRDGAGADHEGEHARESEDQEAPDEHERGGAAHCGRAGGDAQPRTLCATSTTVGTKCSSAEGRLRALAAEIDRVWWSSTVSTTPPSATAGICANSSLAWKSSMAVPGAAQV